MDGWAGEHLWNIVMINLYFILFLILILRRKFLRDTKESEEPEDDDTEQGDLCRDEEDEDINGGEAVTVKPPIAEVKVGKIHEFRDWGGDATCPVCLEDFKNGDRVLELSSCEHRFHWDCFRWWLQKNGFCPMCRSFVYVLDNAFTQTW